MKVGGRLYRIRSLRMLEAKIMTGASTALIAKQFNVSPVTVARSLDYAARAGLVAGFEDQILSALVPLAVTAFQKALTAGDTTVALEVLKGTGLLKKQVDKPTVSLGDPGESLEIYIRKIRGSASDDEQSTTASTKPTLLGQLVARPALAAGGAAGALDGDVIEVEPSGSQDPPPPPAGVCASGDENRPAQLE